VVLNDATRDDYEIADDGTGFRRDWLNVLRFRRPYVVTRNGFIVALAPTKSAARRSVREIRREREDGPR
jgi:hypothetical protein